jgi:hypothetical protein
MALGDHAGEEGLSHTLHFGEIYTNDTGLDGETFLTGSPYFQAKEIEVFQITE